MRKAVFEFEAPDSCTRCLLFRTVAVNGETNYEVSVKEVTR